MWGWGMHVPRSHLATLMLAKEPRMWMCVSASTMRVRVEFSMVNFVFPCLPEMRPIVRDRCSPRNVCARPDRARQLTIGKSTARGEG